MAVGLTPQSDEPLSSSKCLNCFNILPILMIANLNGKSRSTCKKLLISTAHPTIQLFSNFYWPYGASTNGLVAQWITRLTTDQKIPGSNPGELEICFDQGTITELEVWVASDQGRGGRNPGLCSYYNKRLVLQMPFLVKKMLGFNVLGCLFLFWVTILVALGNGLGSP